MLILTEAQVRQCLRIESCIAANREALGSLSSMITPNNFENNINSNNSNILDQSTKKRRFNNDHISTTIEDKKSFPQEFNLYGKSIVPTRIGLPYYSSSQHDSHPGKRPQDWTLFKPAAYYYPDNIKEYKSTEKDVNQNDSKHISSSFKNDHDKNISSTLMGMKVVSTRANNPSIGKPTVPATIVMLNSQTGEVDALIGGTYLTAARTAAGSAIATELCFQQFNQSNRRTSNHDDKNAKGCMMNNSNISYHLVVFGAGLQAELHIYYLAYTMKDIKRISIVNRSMDRSINLKKTLLSNDIQEFTTTSTVDSNSEISAPSLASSPFLDCDIECILLSDSDSIQQVLQTADIIVTATNTPTPLFRGEWVKTGCHINGVGSYTKNMEEVDSEFISNRCLTIIDTKEALDVGDLKLINETNVNYLGLLGDVMRGTNISSSQPFSENSNIVDGHKPTSDGGDNLTKFDCTVFKSVGTAIQDILTAKVVIDTAKRLGLGTNIQI